MRKVLKSKFKIKQIVGNQSKNTRKADNFSKYIKIWQTRITIPIHDDVSLIRATYEHVIRMQIKKIIDGFLRDGIRINAY